MYTLKRRNTNIFYLNFKFLKKLLTKQFTNFNQRRNRIRTGQRTGPSRLRGGRWNERQVLWLIKNPLFCSDDNQHDVIYLSGMSNTASIAGEITDMDSYIIDDYQDQAQGSKSVDILLKRRQTVDRKLKKISFFQFFVKFKHQKSLLILVFLVCSTPLHSARILLHHYTDF